MYGGGNSEFAGQLVLLVFGIFWCGVIIHRFRDDLAIIRESDDKPRKTAVAFIWTLTVPIALTVLIASPYLASQLLDYITR